MDEKFLLDHENAERILEEGWQLFQQKGYRGVTVDELCLRCGITKPTLYYYFQDKENLFVQVLQYRLRGFHHEVERPGSLVDRLGYVAANILESFQTEYSTLLRDREHLKKSESLNQVRDSFRGELFGPLFSLMQAGVDQGQLRPENPEVLTLIFLGIVNNFIGKAAELGVDNAALARKLTTYFLSGAGQP
jgi:AcrR family transcriptional regulator